MVKKYKKRNCCAAAAQERKCLKRLLAIYRNSWVYKTSLYIFNAVG